MDNALEKIYKSGLKFLVPLTAEETYANIVHEAIKLVKGDEGVIFLGENGVLRETYSSVPDRPTKIRKRGYTYRAYIKRESFVVNAKQLAAAHPNIIGMGIKSIIYIPLSYKNKAIGVLVVRSDKETGFASNEPDILKLFGSMASLAIRKTQLYDEAKKALEVRDLFLSMAAHEFRTPITTISGYVQLLASKIPENLSPQSRWVEELSWETNRLASLVNELLEISRIKGGQFQYIWRECHLANVLERAIAEFRFSYPDRKLVFENRLKDNQDIVVGDFDKLLQVVANLLDNAAKFSPPATEIIVSLKAKSPNLVLTVRDLGLGIDSKDLSKVFEGFYRGGNISGEGMGLGLFLAKSIVAQHRGFIDIQSKLNKGTIVRVELPRVKI